MFTACSCFEPKVVVTNDGKVYHRDWDASITYTLDGQNIIVGVDQEKSLTFQSIYNNATELEEKPDCTFSENCMFTVAEENYLVAEDGSPYFKHGDKYYQTSISDRYILNQIFTDYGVVGLPSPEDDFANAPDATKKKKNK